MSINSQQPSQTSTIPSISLDEIEIQNAINTNKIYEKEGLKLYRWGGQANSNNYLAEYKDDKNSYIGILNALCMKEGFGKWKFNNGDQYFGMYNGDLMDKHGMYEFAEKENNDKREKEIYFGLFKQGQKYDHGVYIWLSEPKSSIPYNDFEKADFDVYVGNLNGDNFTHGTYMSKMGERYYVYHGGFDENRKKKGKYSFYYNAQNDSLLYGKVDNDKFIESYVGMFDEEGNLKDTGFIQFDTSGTIITFKPGNEIDNIKDIETEMINFRNIILGKDYFGDVYELFKKATTFINNNVNKDNFDSADKFPDIMQISFEFNKAKIYSDIENIMHLKEKEEQV